MGTSKSFITFIIQWTTLKKRKLLSISLHNQCRLSADCHIDKGENRQITERLSTPTRLITGRGGERTTNHLKEAFELCRPSINHCQDYCPNSASKKPSNKKKKKSNKKKFNLSAVRYRNSALRVLCMSVPVSHSWMQQLSVDAGLKSVQLAGSCWPTSGPHWQSKEVFAGGALPRVFQGVACEVHPVRGRHPWEGTAPPISSFLLSPDQK